MSPPTALCMRFDIACPVDHAFRTWTSRIALWWPTSHTMTGDEHLEVIIEKHVGGRIYERTRTGREADWGQVVRWEPPRVFGFSWHLGTDADQATDVELTCVPAGQNATIVELVHTGWDRLGAEGPVRRERNTGGWNAVFQHFAQTFQTDQRAAGGQPHQ